MRARWEDLNARARGLATHLVDGATVEGLARIGAPGQLAAELVHRGLVSAGDVPEPASPAGLERALMRRRGERLSLVARWARERTRHLAVVFLEEDRRSVRAVTRGVLAGTRQEELLGGLCPTPTLPSHLLERLARQRELAGAAALLEVADHPFAPPVRALSDEAPPDLFRFDLALSSAFAAASEPPRGAGRLRRFRAETIDLENTWTLLLAGGSGDEGEAKSFYLEGGVRLDGPAFGEIFREPSAEERRRAAAHALRGSFAGPALGDAGLPLPRLPRAIHQARVREERRVGRLRPHTVAPLLEYLLRLRGEAMALRRVVWGLALGAGPERRTP